MNTGLNVTGRTHSQFSISKGGKMDLTYNENNKKESKNYNDDINSNNDNNEAN